MPELTTKDIRTLQGRTFYGKEKKSLAAVVLESAMGDIGHWYRAADSRSLPLIKAVLQGL